MNYQETMEKRQELKGQGEVVYRNNYLNFGLKPEQIASSLWHLYTVQLRCGAKLELLAPEPVLNLDPFYSQEEIDAATEIEVVRMYTTEDIQKTLGEDLRTGKYKIRISRKPNPIVTAKQVRMHEKQVFVCLEIAERVYTLGVPKSEKIQFTEDAVKWLSEEFYLGNFKIRAGVNKF